MSKNVPHGPRNREPDFDSSKDAVYLKNDQRLITYANPLYRQLFSKGAIPIGKLGDAYLDKSIARISRRTDLLILEDAMSVRFEHSGIAHNFKLYNMSTCKVNLAKHGENAFRILGVTRIESEIVLECNPSNLDHQYSLFSNFSNTEKQICYLLATGSSTKEIANVIGCSTRTIENRRNNITKTLGLTHQIEIVKMLVRLEERGHLDRQLM